MSGSDLDPLFLKGLRLLHSRARDSADQLRQMLDDVLAQRHSSGGPIAPLSLTFSRQDKNIISIKQESDVKHSISKKVSPKHLSGDFSSSKTSSDDLKRKDAEKRQFERLKQELSDLQGFEQSKDLKRPRLDSPHSSSLSSSPSPQPLVTNTKLEVYSEPSTGSASTYHETADSDTSDDTTDAEGFAIQMGLTCVICKQLDVSARNQLIECQECHNLYHQECHRPAVTEQEINDPRNVWYCARCTKTMKKVTTPKVPLKPVPKPSLPIVPPAPSRDNFPSAKIMKNEAQAPSLLPFKRTEVKTSVIPGNTVSTSSHTNKPTGLAGLAANLGARSGLPPPSLSGGSTNKPGFGPPKSSSSTSMLTSKSIPFPSLSTLSAKPPPTPSISQSPSKTGNALGGLASLANAAASISKASSLSSSSSKHSSASSGSGRISSSASGGGGGGGNSSSGNGGNGASSVGSKTAVSSSLMSADKRLQIMKKKAAAKMQEKRRLSSK